MALNQFRNRGHIRKRHCSRVNRSFSQCTNRDLRRLSRLQTSNRRLSSLSTLRSPNKNSLSINRSPTRLSMQQCTTTTRDNPRILVSLLAPLHTSLKGLSTHLRFSHTGILHRKATTRRHILQPQCSIHRWMEGCPTTVVLSLQP